MQWSNGYRFSGRTAHGLAAYKGTVFCGIPHGKTQRGQKIVPYRRQSIPLEMVIAMPFETNSAAKRQSQKHFRRKKCKENGNEATAKLPLFYLFNFDGEMEALNFSPYPHKFL